MTNGEIWQSILSQIQLDVPSTNFGMWFKSTAIISISDGEATIAVPNLFVQDWLKQKYNKQILRLLREFNEDIREVKFQIEKNPPPPANEKPVSAPPKIGGQMEFEEFKLNRDNNLNPKYNFNNFIVGSYNELAHAASRAVAKNPGSVYNPLFIYGSVGLGKTHLLQAIGNEIINTQKDKRVKYIPSEKLVSEIVYAIQGNYMEKVREKYANTSAIIIDDIQFLTGKEKTQLEFFHIFNDLFNKNKQIVLSSDRAPKAIPDIFDRLRSRFEGGMIADINLPEFETRLAILKTKCQQMNLSFSDEILSYIANSVKENIREMEGALTKFAAQTQLNNNPPTLEACRTMFLTLNPKKVTNLKKIIQGAANFYDLKEKDIMSDSRKKEIVKPRQIIMYLLREELNASFPFIGRKMGDKDHTTVMHAYKKISEQIKTQEDFQEEINLLKQKIYNS